jgi:hypothetical protein
MAQDQSKHHTQARGEKTMSGQLKRESTGAAVNSLSINSNVNTEYNQPSGVMSSFLSNTETIAMHVAQTAFVLFLAYMLGLSLAGG